MSLPKGISGNPKGTSAKKRERMLSKMLQQYGDKEFITANGNATTYAKETARLVWQAAAEGKIEFGDGHVLKAGIRDWRDTVSFIYNQVDGPARLEQDINLTGADSAIAQAPLEQLLALVRSVDVGEYLREEDMDEDNEEDTGDANGGATPGSG